MAFVGFPPRFLPEQTDLLVRRPGMYTKKKNRTLAESGQGAHFYVSLTANPILAAAEKRFGGTDIGILATEIGPVATGILGVFPACTSRRGYMYISAARK